jgi:tetratricopeptide (TPR) repeat protein
MLNFLKATIEKIMKKNLQIAVFFILLTVLCSGARASTADQEYRKANKLFAKGKYQEAIVLYQSLLADSSRSISSGILYSRMADSYFRLGDYARARETYRKALKEQRESERPATQYWIGFSAFMMGKHAEAVNEFLKIPELYPDSGMWVSTSYYWAGRVCERMGKKSIAAEYFRKAGGSGKSAQERFALEKAEKNRGQATKDRKQEF